MILLNTIFLKKLIVKLVTNACLSTLIIFTGLALISTGFFVPEYFETTAVSGIGILVTYLGIVGLVMSFIPLKLL